MNLIKKLCFAIPFALSANNLLAKQAACDIDNNTVLESSGGFCNVKVLGGKFPLLATCEGANQYRLQPNQTGFDIELTGIPMTSQPFVLEFSWDNYDRVTDNSSLFSGIDKLVECGKNKECLKVNSGSNLVKSISETTGFEVEVIGVSALSPSKTSAPYEGLEGGNSEAPPLFDEVQFDLNNELIVLRVGEKMFFMIRNDMHDPNRELQRFEGFEVGGGAFKCQE